MEKQNINYDYKKIKPFKWFVLNNFPFIEEDFDALTNWQLFCKLGKEINNVITSQNLVGEQAEKLTDAFNQLTDYVNNYFDNLDVTDEINTKLDDMVTDGTIEKIINQNIFNEINNKISKLSYDYNNNTTVFMSDSYGVGYSYPNWVQGWPTFCKNALNLSENEYYNISESGSGFLKKGDNDHTFLELLKTNVNNINNKENVTRLIVCAGGNDARYCVDNYINSTTQMDNAIQIFIEYAKSQFPNAKIYLGVITNFAQWRNESLRDFNSRQKLPLIINSYKNSIRLGAYYLNGVETIMKDYTLFSEDKVHPNENGYKILGEGIAQAIQTGLYQYNDQYNKIELTLADFVDNENSSFAINDTLVGDVMQFSISDIFLKFTSPQSYGSGELRKKELIIGKVNPRYYRTSYLNQARIITQGYINEGEHIYSGIFILYIDYDGNLVVDTSVLLPNENLYHTPSNVTEIFLKESSIAIPTNYC